MGLLLHDPAQFSDVSEVVHELVKQTGVDSSRLLLVGARCRDLLHHQFGYQDSLRRTDDIDIGLVATSLHDYRQIVSVLPRIGRTGARFAVGAFAVDIMPFGPIEHPDGTVVFGPQLEKLSVESFQAVWANAQTINLDAGLSIRVPHAAGYAVLKAHAYAERSARFELRDAPDIATILRWYRDAEAVASEVYETQRGNEILTMMQFDLFAASAYVLGVHMQEFLPPADRNKLRQAWTAVDDSALATRIAASSGTLDTHASLNGLRQGLESAGQDTGYRRSWPL